MCQHIEEFAGGEQKMNKSPLRAEDDDTAQVSTASGDIPVLDLGAQRITARLAAGRSSFCFQRSAWDRPLAQTRDTKLLRHLRGGFEESS
jgi:hypothetical protein